MKSKGNEFLEKWGRLLREMDEGGVWKYMHAPVLLRGASNDFNPLFRWCHVLRRCGLRRITCCLAKTITLVHRG